MKCMQKCLKKMYNIFIFSPFRLPVRSKRNILSGSSSDDNIHHSNADLNDNEECSSLEKKIEYLDDKTNNN